MADQNKSGSAGGPDDKAIQDLLQKCKDNPDYKVLTRAEYEKLLALSTVVTTTPHTLRTQSVGQDVRPRFTFRNPLDASSPIPRFQQRFINSPGFNTSRWAPNVTGEKMEITFFVRPGIEPGPLDKVLHSTTSL